MSNEKSFWLKNCVVIGQGAPNQLKDKRISKCIVLCELETKKLHRIYPVPMGWLRQWDVCEVCVEKNPTDHRKNTWKIFRSKDDWKKLKEWIKVKDKKYSEKERKELIKSLSCGVVLSDLIKNGESFGIIRPKIMKFELEQRNPSTTKQMTLINDLRDLDEGFCIINQKDYKFKPYITYECEGNCQCKNKTHRQQTIEWGCYEWMRKNPNDATKLAENLRLFDNEYDKYLLVGNIHKAPQTYIIINIFRFKNKT